MSKRRIHPSAHMLGTMMIAFGVTLIAGIVFLIFCSQPAEAALDPVIEAQSEYSQSDYCHHLAVIGATGVRARAEGLSLQAGIEWHTDRFGFDPMANAIMRAAHSVPLNPDLTIDEMANIFGGELIQKAMPHLSDSEREFIISGSTDDEWDEAFPDDDDHQPDEAQEWADFDPDC